jgi:hypothetical protein
MSMNNVTDLKLAISFALGIEADTGFVANACAV